MRCRCSCGTEPLQRLVGVRVPPGLGCAGPSEVWARPAAETDVVSEPSRRRVSGLARPRQCLSPHAGGCGPATARWTLTMCGDSAVVTGRPSRFLLSTKSIIADEDYDHGPPGLATSPSIIYPRQPPACLLKDAEAWQLIYQSNLPTANPIDQSALRPAGCWPADSDGLRVGLV